MNQCLVFSLCRRADNQLRSTPLTVYFTLLLISVVVRSSIFDQTTRNGNLGLSSNGNFGQLEIKSVSSEILGKLGPEARLVRS